MQAGRARRRGQLAEVQQPLDLPPPGGGLRIDDAEFAELGPQPGLEPAARERQKVLGLLEDVDRNRLAIFRSLTLLRQLSLHAGLVEDGALAVPSAKIDALVEHLAEVAAGGHRALVFSQFTGFLGLVRERLAAEGIEYCYLDGKTRRRAAQIEAFRAGADPVFPISLKAGGFGLNLTEADYVFLLDPWWKPAADTIEAKVRALAVRKAELFADVLDDDGTPAFAQALTA